MEANPNQAALVPPDRLDSCDVFERDTGITPVVPNNQFPPTIVHTLQVHDEPGQEWRGDQGNPANEFEFGRDRNPSPRDVDPHSGAPTTITSPITAIRSFA